MAVFNIMASLSLTYSAANSSSDTITFNDEIDSDGEVMIEVNRKDHAGFPDDTYFYLSKAQLTELKSYLERVIKKFD